MTTESAKIVIIGGGVGGVSVAYHLTELGERDVVLLDRDELTSGSTFHSAGLVGQLRSDPALTRMNKYSVDLYRKLGAEAGWVECGGIRLASSAERLEEIRRQIAWARTFGLPLEEISAADAAAMFPLMDTDGVYGGAYLPTDGYIDPSQLCYALAAGARKGGARIHQHTCVTGINVEDGRVTGVVTDKGEIACETVVNCGGMFAAEIGRLAGVRIPLIPMSHQYVVTDGFLEPGARLPTLRDPDLLVYYRQDVDGLVLGGYERDSATFENVPADFNGRLLPEDWDRLYEIIGNAHVRVPRLTDVGLRTVVNGPEAFTPDNEFILGETEVAGFFVAAGFCAHGIAGAGGIGKVMAEWIASGDPGLDVWHMDVRRFGAHYRSEDYTRKRVIENYETYYDIRYPGHERQAGRPLRTSPAYAWHAGHGAAFGEKAGWERVNYYDANDNGDESERPDGWAGRHWSPAIGAEHRGTREAAGLFDETSFSKISVSGPDAARFLEWVCDNRVARGRGKVTYTQALNERGGIECDFTVTQLGDDEFLIVTGTAFGSHDLGWLRKQRGDLRVRLADVTGQYACFALWGPKAKEIVGAEQPFMTMRETTVGDIPVMALRVTFVGEYGWEFYCSSEYGAALWQTLWDMGRPHGMIAGGYKAIDSMRLEKGFRVWGADIGPEVTPYEAGLGFCVKMDKEFIGRDALGGDIEKRLCRIALSDPRQVVLGNEPVRVDSGGRAAGKGGGDGTAVEGRVTSGGYGYTARESIAYAYLPVAYAVPETAVEVGLFGRWIPATVV